MTIEEMHYSFKMGLNRGNSQINRELLIPEVDFYLNQGMNMFIKMIAQPRVNNNYLGFEKSQRNIDDIKALVLRGVPLAIVSDKIELPTNYLFFISARVLVEKKGCKDKTIVLKIQQQDDVFEYDNFYKSSFEWEEINGVFVNNSIELVYENFIAKTAYLSYIKKPVYIHYAEGYNQNGYRDINNNLLTGKVACELSSQCHQEIVDLALELCSRDLSLPEHKIIQEKLKYNL